MIKVWILDPAANTPYYDVDLTAALREAGVDARLMTSRYLYDENLPRAERYAEYFFFKPLERRAQFFRHRARLRRISRLTVYPFDLYRLWREFRQHPPDVIHIQWTYLPPLDSKVLRRLTRSIPLVLTVHNPLPRAAAFSRLSDMTPFYLLADHLIVHAEQNRQSVLERAPVDPDRVSVVPLGPSLEAQPLVTRDEARAQLGLPADAQVILFFGIIKPYKGLHDLIEAMALIHEKYPAARMLIGGRAEGDGAVYREAIQAHGLEEVTTAHMEFIPTAEVPAYFAASDIYCLPYRDASQSAALLTAYRFGCPVVVTDVGGLPETVENGRNGYVVPANNPPALAGALGRLLDNPAERERFGARSYELSQTRFGWKRAAELTCDIYRQVIGS